MCFVHWLRFSDLISSRHEWVVGSTADVGVERECSASKQNWVCWKCINCADWPLLDFVSGFHCTLTASVYHHLCSFCVSIFSANDLFGIVLDERFVEHDTYDLFERIMRKMMRFFAVSQPAKVWAVNYRFAGWNFGFYVEWYQINLRFTCVVCWMDACVGFNSVTVLPQPLHQPSRPSFRNAITFTISCSPVATRSCISTCKTLESSLSSTRCKWTWHSNNHECVWWDEIAFSYKCIFACVM